jgi:hypothetical protein
MTAPAKHPNHRECDKGQSASESIFELTTASPANRFTHNLPLLALSMIWVFSWCGNRFHHSLSG